LKIRAAEFAQAQIAKPHCSPDLDISQKSDFLKALHIVET